MKIKNFLKDFLVGFLVGAVVIFAVSIVTVIWIDRIECHDLGDC